MLFVRGWATCPSICLSVFTICFALLLFTTRTTCSWMRWYFEIKQRRCEAAGGIRNRLSMIWLLSGAKALGTQDHPPGGRLCPPRVPHTLFHRTSVTRSTCHNGNTEKKKKKNDERPKQTMESHKCQHGLRGTVQISRSTFISSCLSLFLAPSFPSVATPSPS